MKLHIIATLSELCNVYLRVYSYQMEEYSYTLTHPTVELIG